jgi:hypothetical protein
MTAGQQVPGQSGHDTALHYRDEIIAGRAVEVERWDWYSHTDAGIVHYYAKGPCPACHTDTQDHLADVEPPIEGLGPPAPSPDTTLPADSIEMPVRCRCGTDHGQAGAGGCGRRWSIIGPRIPR